MQKYSNKKKNITDRILQILDLKGISKYKFHKDLGFSNGFLDKSRDIGTDKYAKILDYFTDINPQWLLTGKGEMLRSEELASAQPVMKGTEGLKPIPLVYQDAVAGFGSGEFCISEQDVKEYYVIPKFKHTKVDFMIEVRGNSMYPKYNSGDVVACCIIQESRFIQWNKPHVIATMEQGILVKRLLQGSSDDTLVLKSDNKDYPPFEVPKEEITGIALIVGVIRIE